MRIYIWLCCILCLDPSSLCDSTWSNHQAQTVRLWLQGHWVHGQGNCRSWVNSTCTVAHTHVCISLCLPFQRLLHLCVFMHKLVDVYWYFWLSHVRSAANVSTIAHIHIIHATTFMRAFALHTQWHQLDNFLCCYHLVYWIVLLPAMTCLHVYFSLFLSLPPLPPCRYQTILEPLSLPPMATPDWWAHTVTSTMTLYLPILGI